ncbi:MAG: UbiA family prenyltransferase, partial [Defluviicoccus sp.]|nr:UbiA family prenyltransferase [Defluviicoccus sp.]
MSGMDHAASDIPKGGWVDRRLPASWRPYARLARLDRPIGTWLLLFPCWWSIAFASPEPLSRESLVLFALFGIGALVMRGAGCTFNDICDRDFDARV